MNVTGLDLKGSKLSNICDDTLDFVLHTSNLKWLSLAQNNLTKISQKFQLSANNLDKLWLAGNPFHCDCDMIWMIDWIGNATAPSGGRLVQDYQDITCVSGLWKDIPVFKLNDSVLECTTSAIPPKHLQNLTGLILGVCSGFIFLCLVIILVYKNRGSVRQWVYKHFEQKSTTEESVDRGCLLDEEEACEELQTTNNIHR